ncbi:MAG TPA: NAD(P)-dependent oxidoreductase [Thermomicrobiales bacterium]|nr:NAD(P)-dependent oxidoreductase [Thermomicrobiales bacterium]
MNGSTLGVIGLGRMGSPIAGRLVVAGYRVLGFDRAGTNERLPDGAMAAASVAAMAGEAETILLSVPDGAASLAVSREIAATADRRVRTVVDLSTIGIAAARECADLLAGAGVAYVDAPVSGGVAGARGGTLAMMVGAAESLVTELDPILAVVAAKRFRVGDAPGQGQAMKLLNNYASAAALAATCEATVFGARLGLDLAAMVDVINASSGRSAASEDKFPRSIVPGSYDFGFAGALMTKDVSLYLDNAAASGVPHELADAVAAIWRRFNAADPDADFTALHRYLAEGGS